MGGKGGGGDVTVQPSPYESTMSGLIKQLYEETTPLRTEATRQLTDFMYSGNIPEYYSPVREAAKAGIEGQYNIAKENLISTLPRGGGLATALGNLESDRAASLGNINASIAQDLLSKAYGVAFGSPQQAISGLGTIAGTYGSRQAAAAAAEAQQNAAEQAMYGQLGMGLGILGGKILPKLL